MKSPSDISSSSQGGLIDKHGLSASLSARDFNQREQISAESFLQKQTTSNLLLLSQKLKRIYHYSSAKGILVTVKNCSYFMVLIIDTVKPVLSGHSKRTPKIGFQYRLSLNACQKYCRMLHSAILLTCIKLSFSIKTLVLSIFKWPLKTGFTVFSIKNLIPLIDAQNYSRPTTVALKV